MLASLWLIAKIAARLIHPNAGWFAAFLCLTLRGFNYQAADARPYALATFLTAASLWLLISWLERGRWRDAVLFAIAASLLWRVHLVLWPVYVLFVLYAAVRIARADTRVGWPAACLVFGIVGVSLIPVLREAVALNTQAAQHVMASVPRLVDLSNQLKLGLVGGAFAIAAVASWLLRWPAASRPIPWESLALILAWWLCDPLCLFLYSTATRTACSLSATCTSRSPARRWRLRRRLPFSCRRATGNRPPCCWAWAFSCSPDVGIICAWNITARIGAAPREPWMRRRSRPQTVVICPSPFIEARPPVWRPDYPLNSFLYSHLLTYSFRGKKIPFPYQGSIAAGNFAAALSERELAKSGRFAIYGSDRQVKFWRDWFESRPELAGIRSRSLGDFGDVVAVVFERGTR